jgi:hypothetical protein
MIMVLFGRTLSDLFGWVPRGTPERVGVLAVIIRHHNVSALFRSGKCRLADRSNRSTCDLPATKGDDRNAQVPPELTTQASRPNGR